MEAPSLEHLALSDLVELTSLRARASRKPNDHN
jgi:hypothetical protein